MDWIWSEVSWDEGHCPVFMTCSTSWGPGTRRAPKRWCQVTSSQLVPSARSIRLTWRPVKTGSDTQTDRQTDIWQMLWWFSAGDRQQQLQLLLRCRVSIDSQPKSWKVSRVMVTRLVLQHLDCRMLHCPRPQTHRLSWGSQVLHSLISFFLAVETETEGPCEMTPQWSTVVEHQRCWSLTAYAILAPNPLHNWFRKWFPVSFRSFQD